MIFKITDFKQFVYCPRIIYFEYCFPVEKKNTTKMEIGKDYHDTIERLEKRRVLKKYGLESGESFYEKYLFSEKTGLSGKIDRLIRSGGKYYPVDYKNTGGRVWENHILQLAGYSLLIDEKYDTDVDRGFIFLLLKNKIEEVKIDKILKEKIKSIIMKMNDIVENETMPIKNGNINKCIDCEYRRFCNDIE